MGSPDVIETPEEIIEGGNKMATNKELEKRLKSLEKLTTEMDKEAAQISSHAASIEKRVQKIETAWNMSASELYKELEKRIDALEGEIRILQNFESDQHAENRAIAERIDTLERWTNIMEKVILCPTTQKRLDAMDKIETLRNTPIDWTKYACPTCMHWGWNEPDKKPIHDGTRGHCSADVVGMPQSGIYLGIFEELKIDLECDKESAMPRNGECEGYHKRKD